MNLPSNGIGRGAKDGNVVFPVHGDELGLEQLRRGHGAIDEDVRLAAAIAKRAQDVRGGEQVALIVDEEGVAEKDVLVAPGRRRLIDGIDDGANGGGKRGIVRGRRWSAEAEGSPRGRPGLPGRVSLRLEPHGRCLDCARSRIARQLRVAMGRRDRESSERCNVGRLNVGNDPRKKR